MNTYRSIQAGSLLLCFSISASILLCAAPECCNGHDENVVMASEHDANHGEPAGQQHANDCASCFSHIPALVSISAQSAAVHAVKFLRASMPPPLRDHPGIPPFRPPTL